MLLRARIVLPVSKPPLENGAVLISQNRVAAVGPWRELAPRQSAPAFDLGEVILLPGLVNAHCHLDYTDMTGLPPQKQFPDWIKGLLALKAGSSYTDYADAWIAGAKMLAPPVHHGGGHRGGAGVAAGCLVLHAVARFSFWK